jgi:hypothetical protein
VEYGGEACGAEGVSEPIYTTALLNVLPQDARATFLSPFQGLAVLHHIPWAYALGCILAPLRG